MGVLLVVMASAAFVVYTQKISEGSSHLTSRRLEATGSDSRVKQGILVAGMNEAWVS